MSKKKNYDDITFRSAFREASLIGIKIGTTRVIENEKPNKEFITNLGLELKKHVIDQSKSAFVVASGAVALGRQQAGYSHDQDLSPEQKQHAFAYGNVHHGILFNECFGMAGLKPCAGHLLTPNDLTNTDRKANLISVTNRLFIDNATPIFNENDLVSTQELAPGDDGKWGDNDKLSAQISSALHADVLLILTDVDGMYTAHPEQGGEHIRIIPKVEKSHFKMALGKGSALSTGGMFSKLQAAQIAQEAGITTIIAKGERYALSNLLNGTSRCTIIPGLK